MPVNISQSTDKIFIYLSGEIDHHGAKQIREETDAKILLSKPKEVILNFKDVSFMDSSGIGLIMGRYRLANSYGGKVFVDEASNYLKRVMKLAGIDAIVCMRDISPDQKNNKENIK